MSISKLVTAMNHLDDDLIMQAITEPSPKKKVGMRWAAAAAVLALVVGCAIPLWRELHKNTELSPTGTGPYTGNLTEPYTGNLLQVNEIGDPSQAQMDIDLQVTTYAPEALADIFQQVTGIAYSDLEARLSGLLTVQSIYSEDVQADWESSEYTPYDFVLEGQTDAGGEVRLALSAFGKPCRDTIIVCNDPASSKIGDMEVQIYHAGDAYYAQFVYEDVYYDLETVNVSLEELETLLSVFSAAA